MEKAFKRDDWWKYIFDDLYLKADARSLTPEITGAEVDFLENIFRQFSLSKDAKICDCCGGQGRHSLELALRGYGKCTVVDYSRRLLWHGQVVAQKKKLPVTFHLADARNTKLKAGVFNWIIFMTSSFGYFVNEQDNMSVLNEAYRLLDIGGYILLDLPDKECLIANFKSYTHHSQNELLINRWRRWEGNAIVCREQILDKDGEILRDYEYQTKIYDKNDIRKLLAQSGFANVLFPGILTGGYDNVANRMVVVAQKK